MRIDDIILHALKQAVENAGDAKEFAAKCQVSASNISRYLSGKVRSISDRCWEKMLPELDLPPVRHADGTVANTPELRSFIADAMQAKGMSTPEQLNRAIGYNSPQTIRRLLIGELNWFPDVLSAVFDALDRSPDDAPLRNGEKEMLSPFGFYSDGAMLVRPVPIVEWANAASHLASLESGNVLLQSWDIENTPTVPVPASSRRDTAAFKVHGISMEPRILDDDIVLVEPVENLDSVQDNKVVVVRFNENSDINETVVCKRFRRQGKGQLLLTSDNPEGKIIPFTPKDVAWIGVVVRKISEM